jgi:hypothetical protein
MSSPDSSAPADAVARYVSFATAGAIAVTQDLTHAVLGSIGDMEGTDPELVAEETLCLVATASARAAQVGLREQPGQSDPIARALLALPFAYRDYLIGSAMISTDDASLADLGETVRARLQRKQEFYTSHLPDGQFPGPHALKDKMELWMGRVSPPKLPESPQERLQTLDLVDSVAAHCKLLLAYGRRGDVPGGSAAA